MKIQNICLSLLLLLSSGCLTADIIGHASATIDSEGMTNCEKAGQLTVVPLMFPICLAWDTVFFPATIIQALDDPGYYYRQGYEMSYKGKVQESGQDE